MANAIDEARSTNMPGSVATTDTISIHCGLNFSAATINGNVIETASSQDTNIAQRINRAGTIQRNGRYAMQIIEIQTTYNKNENRKFIRESENNVKSVVACTISHNVFLLKATHIKFDKMAETITRAKKAIE